MNIYRTNTYVAPPPEKKSLALRVTKKAAAIGVFGFLAVAGVTGCPQAQQAQTIMQPAEACIVDNLFLNGGLANPMAVVTACAGVTISDVIQVIEMLLKQAPDASMMTDGGAAAVAVQVGGSMHVVARADLEAALAKAKASLAQDAAAH